MCYISWLEHYRRRDDRLKMAIWWLKPFYSYGYKWLPQRCYSLLWTANAWNMLYTATIATLLLGFHLKNWAPPTKNGSAATITIKPEHLAHCCVDQGLLYPWMCYSSWFELHRSQDECFSVPPSVITSLKMTFFYVGHLGVGLLWGVVFMKQTLNYYTVEPL